MKSIKLTTIFIASTIVYSSTLLSQTVIGSGTTNNIPKFTAASTIGNSQITDNGTTVSLGTASVAIGASAVTSGDFLTVTKNYNGLTRMRLNNTNSGSAASTSFNIISLGTSLNFASYGLLFSPLGIAQPATNVISAAGNGGLNIVTTSNVSTAGLFFGTNSINRMTITNAGNVGIGTTTPAKKLHVVGDAQIDDLSFASFGGNSWIDASNGLLLNYFSKKTTNINSAWVLQTDPITGNTTIVDDGGQVNMGAKVALTNSLKLGWDGNGVDLNTSIEVNQNANYASGIKVKTWNNSIKAFAVQDANNKNPFLVTGGGNTTINAAVPSIVYFNVNDVSSPGFPIQAFAVSGNGYTKILTTANNALEVADATTSTVNFLVKKTGVVYAREVNVQLSAFPDYVFAKNYHLTPLNEVEQYINTHQHLKGFESAKEYESKGMNVGEVVRLQQEKIEELTLYLIEQQKQLDELKRDMKSLKK